MTFSNRVKNTFRNLVTPRNPLSIEEQSRRKLFTVFSILLIIPLIIFGSELYRKRIYDQAIADTVFILILTTLVLVLFNQKNDKNIYRIAAALLELFLFLIIKYGPFDGYASIWALFFPLFAFFLMGKKEGLFWTTICFLIAAVLLINPYSLFTNFTYPPQFISRHLIVFFAIAMFTYNYESAREKYKSAMESEIKVREQAEVELRRHQDQLEEIVAERTLEIEKNSEELENK